MRESGSASCARDLSRKLRVCGAERYPSRRPKSNILVANRRITSAARPNDRSDGPSSPRSSCASPMLASTCHLSLGNSSLSAVSRVSYSSERATSASPPRERGPPRNAGRRGGSSPFAPRSVPEGPEALAGRLQVFAPQQRLDIVVKVQVGEG